MSIQSEWQPASRKKPAEFDLDYVNIKVQTFKSPQAQGGAIQVRIATVFDTDWQERKFDEWYEDSFGGDNDGAFEALYPLLRELREAYTGDRWALLNAAINELEQRNPGLIRG